MVEPQDIAKLFSAIYKKYGYDFRNYAPASAQRRVVKHLQQYNFNNIVELESEVLSSNSAVDALLVNLSINVTEMFRDPLFYKFLRNNILEEYNDHSHIKIWHAGCSSGEEPYSMAILLKEKSFLKKSQLYATDFNTEVLEKAKSGVLNIKDMRSHIRNYLLSGGKQEFTNYYKAEYRNALIDNELKKHIMFSHHDLTGDSAFGEMDIIVCRNVLIYFNRTLQDRVLSLFSESLESGGYLCLGSHESLRLSTVSKEFDTISEKQKIYRKR